VEDVRLLLGDCLAVLPSIDLGEVALVLTDPPYGMGWDTDSKRFSGGNRPNNRCPGDGRDDWPEVAGDDTPFDPGPWLAFPKAVLWGSNHYAPRLPVGTTLVWIKKADHLFGTFLSDCEVAWMKGGHGVYAFRKQFAPTTRMREGGGKVLHPNQKPVELMAWCMERAGVPQGATVLDPYMGSGTVGMACLRTGRKFIGVEINPDYFAVAQARLANATSEGPLFARQQTLFAGGTP
jgi:site-specific DNA-methyltransferase (adenine-specific)